MMHDRQVVDGHEFILHRRWFGAFSDVQFEGRRVGRLVPVLLWVLPPGGVVVETGRRTYRVTLGASGKLVIV